MALWFYKAYTPGTRNRTVSRFSEITRSEPEKKLTYHSISRTGRNSRGIITIRHRGGGHKRLYRKIDFRRNKIGVLGKVASVEYDPNRNAYICLINYIDGEKKYVLHARGMEVGNIITSGPEASISNGNALPLSAIWIFYSRFLKLIDWDISWSHQPSTSSKKRINLSGQIKTEKGR